MLACMVAASFRHYNFSLLVDPEGDYRQWKRSKPFMLFKPEFSFERSIKTLSLN
jgi:hypothetical protein